MEYSILFSKALSFAADKHQGQTRRDGSAYILHPIKVAEIVRESGYDSKYQIAALLHDTLEDTDATEDEIKFFGEDVFEAVKLLTRPNGMDETEYLDSIFKNHMATIVKAADKIHNMWECAVCDDVRWASKYIEKSKKYYFKKFSKAVDDAISGAAYFITHPLAERGAFFIKKEDMKLYSEINRERYEDFKQKYKPNIKPERCGNEIYYRDELGGFLVIEDNRFFILNPYGWEEQASNPIFTAHNPIEEYPMSCKADYDAFIAKEYEKRDYLFDFVNIEKL